MEDPTKKKLALSLVFSLLLLTLLIFTGFQHTAGYDFPSVQSGFFRDKNVLVIVPHQKDSLNLCSTKQVIPQDWEIRPYYHWNDRVQLPLCGLSRYVSQSNSYTCLNFHKSQDAIQYVSKVTNSDKVFWHRRTDSILTLVDEDDNFVYDYVLLPEQTAAAFTLYSYPQTVSLEDVSVEVTGAPGCTYEIRDGKLLLSFPAHSAECTVSVTYADTSMTARFIKPSQPQYLFMRALQLLDYRIRVNLYILLPLW